MIGLESRSHIGEGIRRIFFGDLPADIVPPGFIIEQDRPEWHFSFRQYDWTFTASVVAAPAGVGQIELLNPGPLPKGDSPVSLSVVTLVKVVAATVGHTYKLNLDPAAAGTPVNNVARDTRKQSVGSVVSQNRILNTGAAPSGVQLEQGNADVSNFVFSTTPYIIGPTHRLAVFDTTVNTFLAVIMAGYDVLVKPEAFFDT